MILTTKEGFMALGWIATAVSAAVILVLLALSGLYSDELTYFGTGLAAGFFVSVLTGAIACAVLINIKPMDTPEPYTLAVITIIITAIVAYILVGLAGLIPINILGLILGTMIGLAFDIGLV